MKTRAEGKDSTTRTNPSSSTSSKAAEVGGSSIVVAEGGGSECTLGLTEYLFAMCALCYASDLVL